MGVRQGAGAIVCVSRRSLVRGLRSFPGAVGRSRRDRPAPPLRPWDREGPRPRHAPRRSTFPSLSLRPHRFPGIGRYPIDGQLSPRVNEKEIVRSRTIGELLAPAAPFDKKCGRENWTVAFAPDGSYFAWSQGHRTVKLVPWSQCLKNFLLHGTKNITNSSSLRLSRQNSDGGQKNKPREHIIDCGDIVWSLAFGSSVPEKQSRCVNIEWHRFRFGQDQLLLATGLNNGRIKIWDVYTGKLLLNLVDHTEVVRDLTFAPDGSLILVSASRDKTLRVWDLKDDGNMMKVLRGHQNWVYSCAFSPDSSMLCSVGASKAVVAAILV